jgi:hypothetical protein
VERGNYESNASLQEKPLDTDQWQKLYYRYQQQYIRKRLDASKDAASVGDPFAADGISSGDNAGISLYATLFTQLNLVEYIIHLLRLRFLHHLPLGTTLVQIEQQLEQFLQSHQFLGSQQVRKTLNFIFSLVA